MSGDHSIILGHDLLDEHGFVVEQGPIRFGGDEHACVHSPSGKGKTTCITIPNAFNWLGSMVVLDVKSECFNATAGYRARQLGQEVYRFDPTALDGKSHRWNPLAIIDRTSFLRYGAIMRQAYLLMPENPTSSSNAEKFWIPAARLAFASVALMLMEMQEEPITLGQVWETFARGDCQEWLAYQIEKRWNDGKPFSRPVVLGVSNFLGGKDETLPDNIRTTVTTTLSAWWNPPVVSATSSSDFDLRDLRRKPMTIYVTIAPGQIDSMRALLALLFDQLVNLNTDVTPKQDPTLKYPALIMLDEFARLGHLPSLARAAQLARGFGLRLAYIIQDPAQLRDLYGFNGARDILSNVGAEVMFGTNDLSVAEEFEKRLGDRTVSQTTISRRRGTFNPLKQNLNESVQRRPLLLRQELLQMEFNRQVIVRGGMPGVFSGRLPWMENEDYVGLVEKPPVIPELTVDPGLDDGSFAVRGVDYGNDDKDSGWVERLERELAGPPREPPLFRRKDRDN